MGCKQKAIWFNNKLIYPQLSPAPSAVDDMPDDVKIDFLEARDVINYSPRSSAALLRLSLEKLLINLSIEGADLNEKIKNLVKSGLHSDIQKTLDIVRVIGNNAVHPGQLDIKDDHKTALYLFELVNMIIDDMISKPKKIAEIYQILPENAKNGIEKRDKN